MEVVRPAKCPHCGSEVDKPFKTWDVKPKRGGKRIDVLFEAVTLENWGTIIDESTIPPRVDHSLLRKGELIEL